MSYYIVRVVGPSGMEQYLKRGRLVQNLDIATKYPHPSNARQALHNFMRDCGQNRIADVIDPRDPERGSV